MTHIVKPYSRLYVTVVGYNYFMCCVWKLDLNLETRGCGRVSHILAEMGIQFIGGPKLQRDRRLLKNFCEMTLGPHSGCERSRRSPAEPIRML